MRGDTKYNCNVCGEEKCKRDLKRKCGKHVCKSCERKKRKEHREKLINGLKEAGIIKHRRTPKEMQEYREKQKELKKERDKKALPNIRSIKKKRIRLPTNIPKKDKQILYRLLVNRGFTSDAANERIKKIEESTKKIREKIMAKAKNKKEAEREFKESFAKTMEKLQ